MVGFDHHRMPHWVKFLSISNRAPTEHKRSSQEEWLRQESAELRRQIKKQAKRARKENSSRVHEITNSQPFQPQQGEKAHSPRNAKARTEWAQEAKAKDEKHTKVSVCFNRSWNWAPEPKRSSMQETGSSQASPTTFNRDDATRQIAPGSELDAKPTAKTMIAVVLHADSERTRQPNTVTQTAVPAPVKTLNVVKPATLLHRFLLLSSGIAHEAALFQSCS